MKVTTIFSHIGALAIGFFIAFFIWGGKKDAPATTTTITVPQLYPVPEYTDTCFLSQQDSFDIYRSVRRGITQKKTNVQPSNVAPIPSPGDSTKINSYTYEQQDSLAYVKVVIDADGKIHNVNMEYRLDTIELIRLFRIRDSIPVYIEPVIVNNTQTVEVIKYINPKGFGATVIAGTHYDPIGKFFAKGGLYFQDRKQRRYGINGGTDKSVEFQLQLPLWTQKK